MPRKFISRATAPHRANTPANVVPYRVTIPTEEQIQSVLLRTRKITDPVVETVPEPIIEPEPVIEPILDPVVETVPEPIIEPEPVIEPILDPVVETVPEPIIEPEPVIEPIPELVVEPEPVVEIMHAPAIEPVPDPVVEPIPEPIIEPDPVVEPVPEPVVEPIKKYTIAILFRGPIRGEVSTVIEYIQNSLDELRVNYIVHAYLATWGTTHDVKLNTLLASIKFDNVIIQTAPADEQIHRFVHRNAMGCYPISNVYRMYYQTKTALDVIVNAYDYDYIIHSRTDVKVTFGEHIQSWLVPGYYISPPSGAPWLCDWVGAAEPTIMQAAWDYDTLDRLGKLLEEKHIPEHIFIDIMSEHSIQHKTSPVASIFLNPDRVEENERL